MMVSASVGLVDSYNAGRKTSLSYNMLFHGKKFREESYSYASDPSLASFSYDFYIDYLNIDGKLILNTQTLLGSFTGSLATTSYRNDGYGLGVSNMIDQINNSNLFSKYEINFYPASLDTIVINTREKTRFAVAFSDQWIKFGAGFTGQQSWTIIGNYPSTTNSPNKELLIGDYIGNFINDFNFQDIDSISGTAAAFYNYI